MIQNAIHAYIKEQLAQHVNRDIIINFLVQKGWQKQDVEDTYASLQTTSADGTPVSSPNDISEKKYPIQFAWIIKSVIPYALVIAYFSLTASTFKDRYIDFSLYGIYIAFHIGYTVLRRKSFQYTLSKKYLVIHQGVISKQQRNIPLGVIQNVYIKQDIIDRIFGLASLSLENASQSGKSTGKFGWLNKGNSSSGGQAIGFDGNGSKVSIPGLKKYDAEALKQVVLQRMKENTTDATQSGL